MPIQKPYIMSDIENIKLKIRPILIKHGIKKAGIFGSSARGESVVHGLDLLVKIKRNSSLLDFIDVHLELKDEWGKKADIVEYEAIKPALRDEILKDELPVIH